MSSLQQTNMDRTQDPARIRALLLAGGLGTRLRPLTVKTPKCLAPIGGKPLLGHWIEKLEDAGCEEVIINTHYLHEVVDQYIGSLKMQSIKIRISHEENYLEQLEH